MVTNVIIARPTVMTLRFAVQGFVMEEIIFVRSKSARVGRYIPDSWNLAIVFFVSVMDVDKISFSCHFQLKCRESPGCFMVMSEYTM